MNLKENIETCDSPAIAREVVVKDSLEVIGKVTVTKIITRYGEVVSKDVLRILNLVVNGGRNTIAQLLGGDSSLFLAYLALGDSKTSSPVLTNTTLENEVKRITYDQGTDKTYPETGSIKMSRTINGDDFGATTVIREGGMVFSDGSASVDTGTLFNRVIFVDDDPTIGLVNAGLVFQPTNASGVAINNKIEFEILF